MRNVTIRVGAALALCVALGAASPVQQPAPIDPMALSDVATAARAYSAAQAKSPAEPEAEKIKREQDDLVAQQQMARGTDAIVQLSAWQLLFGIIGVVGLAFTLHYARKSAFEAKRAVDHAVETSNIELRAYIAQHKLTIQNIAPGSCPTFRVVFINSGQTPAQNYLAWGDVAVYAAAAQLPTQPISNHPGPPHSLGSTSESELLLMAAQVLTQQDVADIHNNIATVAAQIRVSYTDIFGDPQGFDMNVRTVFMNGELRTVLY